MATKNTRSSGTTKRQPAKSSGSKKSTSSSRSGRKQAPEPVSRPIRREVGGVVCLILTLLFFIGYFPVDALFFTFICNAVKGLLGYGYYLLPVATLWAAFILLTHKGRPVILRVTSVLLLPLLFGSFLHIALCKVNITMEGGFGLAMKALYTTGAELKSGGVIAGLVGMSLRSVVSTYGAMPILVLLFLLLTMLGANLSVSKLMDLLYNRQPRPYERQEIEPRQPRRRKQPEPEYIPEPAPARRRRQQAIDIPYGDDPKPKAPPAAEYKDEKNGFFSVNAKVMKPDQYLQQAETPVEPVLTEEQAEEEAAQFVEFGQAEPRERLELKKPAIKLPEAPIALEDDDDITLPLPELDPEPVPVAIPKPVLPKPVPAPHVSMEIRSDAPVEEPGKKLTKEETAQGFQEIAMEIAQGEEEPKEEYVFPPLNLLRSGGRSMVDAQNETNLNRKRLEETLSSFNVDASYKSCTRGPTVTRYDFELHTGVKLTKVTNLSDDIALALGVTNVRIAPIPDKISTVGIEVPNKVVNTVYFRDIIGSENFQTAKSKVSFAIGEDIGGNSIVSNIAKLPHLLIAGTTGSGKSVCINCLLLSLLYKATPEEVKLIMIDPKMVELGVYNGIPHLYVPVVTDPKKAAGALQWSVVEMMKRYRLFSEAGVRDLAGYNSHCEKRGEAKMPQVVIVIDELADLMMVASKEVEESICRVAQMGRAAGMHLVIATQRPSADVITGLMKANIPSRIAFAVSSALESRIILDQSGAEKLIGMGDMLYAPIGVGKPVRIQGAFVSDEERESVIEFVKNNCEADYDLSVQAQIEKAAEEKNSGGKGSDRSDGGDTHSDYDELLPQAVEVVLDAKMASVSMLQRRLKLGYSRAARIVDQMEEIGVVGPFEGSKPRQIMITKEQWLEMQTIQGTAPIERIPSEAPLPEDDEAPF